MSNDQLRPPRTPTQEVADDASVLIATAQSDALQALDLLATSQRKRSTADNRPAAIQAAVPLIQAARQLLAEAETILDKFAERV